MRATLAVTIAAVIALALSLAGQTSGVFPPLDVRVPFPPRPLVSGGFTHLVYELHIANLSSHSTTIEAVEVRDRSAAPDVPAMLRLEGSALEKALHLFGASPDEAGTRVLPGGRTAVVFVWLNAAAGAIPAVLTHRFALRLAGADAAGSSSQPDSARAAKDIAVAVDGVDVPVSSTGTPVIGPPLAGDHWLAANGPGNETGHRRALLAVAGEVRIAQRFAIDWIRLFEDGRTFSGDPRNNASYRAFGANVLAVADALVVDTLDGLPENVPDPAARAVPITPASVTGNYIVLDLGGETYAVYGHLQPGSLRVRKGDRVRRGQVLARVGNTGNSSEPHLHFHVGDRPHPIDAEGVPYALDRFELEAGPEVITPALEPAGGSLQIGASGLSRWKTSTPRRRERELPLLNAVVRFF